MSWWKKESPTNQEFWGSKKSKAKRREKAANDFFDNLTKGIDGFIKGAVQIVWLVIGLFILAALYQCSQI